MITLFKGKNTPMSSEPKSRVAAVKEQPVPSCSVEGLKDQRVKRDSNVDAFVNKNNAFVFATMSQRILYYCIIGNS